MPDKKKTCFCGKSSRCCGRSRSSSCLGRCCLPKHNCVKRKENSPGPIPPCMGWLYNARDAPDFQLRCGWRPGHIACPVLKKIERHNQMKSCCINPPSPRCSTPRCSVPGPVLSKTEPCPGPSVPCKPTPSCSKMPCPKLPSIRIARTAGTYMVSTNPTNIDTSPCGPYPLKYVVNIDETDPVYENTKYCVEAKYNDYQFGYTSSVQSFVLDFAPPECARSCYKPCMKNTTACFPCVVDPSNFGCSSTKSKKSVRLSSAKKSETDQDKK